MHQRLHDDSSKGFSNETKDEIAKSAEIALVRYREQAVPWFQEINTMADIAERHFETTYLEVDELGGHVYEMQLSAANNGLLLQSVYKVKFITRVLKITIVLDSTISLLICRINIISI